MKIQNEETGKTGKFFIDKDGEMLAEMTYTLDGEKRMIIDHTEVGEELRGRHIGNELLDVAVEYARSKEMKILPKCSFAKSVMERKKEYADVKVER